MRYALLVTTMLAMPCMAFATSTTTPADASSSSTDTSATSTDTSSMVPQTNLASTTGSAQRDSWGSFQVGDVKYQATVIDPPGNGSNYEFLLATASDGTTTPYTFELTPGGTGSLPPMANNDLPATPAGGSGSGGTSTGGTDTSTGGVGNNNNIIRIGGKDYQVVPVDSGSGSGAGSGTGSGSGTQTPKTITQLKDELVKAQRDAARLTGQLVTQINNQLPSTDPVPASTDTSSSTSSQQVAAR